MTMRIFRVQLAGTRFRKTLADATGTYGFYTNRFALPDAITNIVGSNDGSIVSCVPGALAYYEGEDLGRRLVLHRKETR